LQRVVNRLLSVEARIHSVSVAALELTLKEYDAKMEPDLALIRPVEKDPDPAIRFQVKRYIDGMERNLKEQKLSEEEGYM